MHRQQPDNAREGLKELGTPISSFRIIGHQRRCARRSYYCLDGERSATQLCGVMQPRVS